MARNSKSSRKSSVSPYMVSLERMDSSYASCHLPPILDYPTRHVDLPPIPASHLDYPTRHVHLHLKSPAPRVDSTKCQLGKSRLHMPRVKFRFRSLLLLVAKMTRSVMPAPTPLSASGAAANHNLAPGITYSCGGSYPGAVVDCIEYIKKNSDRADSSTKLEKSVGGLSKRPSLKCQSYPSRVYY